MNYYGGSKETKTEIIHYSTIKFYKTSFFKYSNLRQGKTLVF